MEPVVYHGYTLTNKILFKEVITTVEQHAFEVILSELVLMGLDSGCCRGRLITDSLCHVILFLQRSPYPVILSLENHCCKEQQEIMAHYLISILGEKLLRAPIDHLTTGELPSPNVRT